jgi:hypothetical protein
MCTHDPNGATIGPSVSANASTNARATRRAAAGWPELCAGCPQHVCAAGNPTSHPSRSSSATVRSPTSG